MLYISIEDECDPQRLNDEPCLVKLHVLRREVAGSDQVAVDKFTKSGNPRCLTRLNYMRGDWKSILQQFRKISNISKSLIPDEIGQTQNGKC